MAQNNERSGSATTSDLADVVQWIKEEIIFGRLRPRERLVEGEISDRLDVSRHLIRAAFSELQSMGLVTHKRNKGAVVRDFSVDEVEEIYEMRSVLQREATMRIALPVSPQLLDELDEILTKYCEAVDKGELQRVCSLNNDFHFTLFDAAKNRCLSDMIGRIWTETLGIRCYAIGDPVWLKNSREEKRQMIDALRGGDRECLLGLVDDHIWPGLELYKRAHGGWRSQSGSSA